MKSSDKKLVIAAAAFAVLVLLVIVADAGRKQAKLKATRPIALSLACDIEDSAVQKAIEEVLKTFSSLYPRIRVSTRYVATGGGDAWAGADLIVGSSIGVMTRAAFLEPPIPWSGELWVLAANRVYLDSAASRLGEEVKALRAGRASPKQFEALLADASGQGLVPFTFGNSHKWPFLLLLQHWTAATKGPKVAAALPAASGNADPYEEYREPFADLMRWKKNGWFPKALWGEGWTIGLAPLDKGEAAFAIVSSRLLSAMSPKGRAALDYLPFPSESAKGSWSVGRATFMGTSKSTKEKDAAKLLEKFLSSPGITSRLAEITGKPFFAWDPKTGLSPAVLQNWTAASSTPDYEAFAREFDPGH